MTLLLWTGLAVSALATLVAFGVLWYALREVMCPTHLGLGFRAFLGPARNPKGHVLFPRFVKARRHAVRSAIQLALGVLMIDSWRSHIIGIFELNGLWVTIPVTLTLLWNGIADCRVIHLLEGLPEEAEAMELARMELDAREEI